MMVSNRTLAEQAAASAVASLGASNDSWGKRPREAALAEQDKDEQPRKLLKTTTNSDASSSKRNLQGPPFFYYRDFSNEKDPDPLTPLTPPGRVPNFPAKMHAILSRPDLTDIVAWLPHGRSWRVLKPREFELRVIPTYFEHSKFSSFIRQANGWGFRRITQGRDRNSYYHELFLRGLPHLCKKMKRPGVAEKAAADAEHEPDLYKISEMRPVPDKAEDETILLPCIVQGGPKARMPIYSGAKLSEESIRLINKHTNEQKPTYVSFQQPIHNVPTIAPATVTTESVMQPQNHSSPVPTVPATGGIMTTKPQAAIALQHTVTPGGSPPPGRSQAMDSHLSSLATADRLAFALQQQQQQQHQPQPQPQPHAPQHQPLQQQPQAPPPATYGNNSAASQFAAGFAAATALSSTHIRNVLEQALVTNPFGAPSAATQNLPK